MVKMKKVMNRGDRLMCVDALRGLDMLWIIGGSEIRVSLTALQIIEIPAGLGKHIISFEGNKKRKKY